MKKTIAILLVLVIAMAGVFALTGNTTDKTASLELSTTVNAYTMLAITNNTTTEYVFANTAPTAAEIATEFDVSTAFGGPTLAAHLHYRTNISSGPTLSVKSTALQNEDDDSFMPFTLTVGDASINPVDDTEVSGNVFNGTTPLTTLTNIALPVNVQITGTDLDDYSAGAYSTTVTFTFTVS